MPTPRFTGPLAGLRVVEMAGIGPAPFCAMVLADLGADVVRIDRPDGSGSPVPGLDPRSELLNRGRRSVAVDLKHPQGPGAVLALVERADALVEGFRPGVMERLGLGPDDCHARNPRLVYGRMTGYGQSGPLAHDAGHDLNYVAHTGLLSLIGRAGQPPTPPLNLVGDFGGGGMVLAVGVLAALWEVQASGEGQVVDAAMTDGAALLGTAFFGYTQTGLWREGRGRNLLDSGAPFYDVYEAADGRYVAVAALEARFYTELLDVLELDPDVLPHQYDMGRWPELRDAIAAAIRTRTRDEWATAAQGRDACLSPVLDITEAPDDPHNQARHTFTEIGGLTQPAPAPRFSRTPAAVDVVPPAPGEHTRSALADWGVDDDQIAAWESAGVIRHPV